MCAGYDANPEKTGDENEDDKRAPRRKTPGEIRCKASWKGNNDSLIMFNDVLHRIFC
jgi:hypothetical protein